MQLLAEEFLKKSFKVINEVGFIPRLVVKLLFFILFCIMLIFAGWYIYTGRYYIVLIVFGMYILAEIAHLIRKSREKVMAKIACLKNQENKRTQEALHPQKSKNKEGLLKTNKEKNSFLLKINKTKNKNILKKSIKEQNPEAENKKEKLKSGVKENLSDKNQKVDRALSKPKNKNLLEINKTKNKDLLNKNKSSAFVANELTDKNSFSKDSKTKKKGKIENINLDKNKI